MLKDEGGEPLQETDPRFFLAYTDAHRSRTKRPEGSMFNLIASFRASAEYTTEISDRTRTSYNRFLKLIEDEFGDMPNDVLQNPKARGEFKAWRDTMAHKPRTEDCAWTVLAQYCPLPKTVAKSPRTSANAGVDCMKLIGRTEFELPIA
jgi:hypothetical protein